MERIEQCLASRSDILSLEAHCTQYPLIFSIKKNCDILNLKNEDQVRVPLESPKGLLHGVNSLILGYRDSHPYDRCVISIKFIPSVDHVFTDFLEGQSSISSWMPT